MLQLVLTLVLLGIGYVVTVAVYRLTLHPLASFPGPKLAGLTFGYAFHWEVTRKGRFTFHIRDLHKQYGPIIRITPDEVHIDDPDFYEELYTKQGRLDRDPRMSPFFGNAASLFSTEPSNLHKIRRAPLAAVFSRKRILELEPLLQEKSKKLLGKLAQYRDSGKPLELNKAFMAFTEDMIFEYCFGECYDKLDAPNFNDNLHDTFALLVQTGYVALYFPWIPKLLMSLPPDLLTKMEPIYATMFRAQKDIRRWALDIQEGRNDAHKSAEHGAVLVELINSNLPAHEKVPNRVGDEAQNLLGAGVSTTGWAAIVTAFYIVNDPSIFRKLHAELEEAYPDPSESMHWTKLEKLPYLQACIKEGLRISTGESIRSPRISDHTITYKDWQIPPHKAVSMSIVDVCFNETIFPDAHTFRPERWLDTMHSLDKYYVFFGKGIRSCLGMQLAYAELYHMIGGVFRNFRLELYETDVSDVEMVHDFFIPLPKLDSKGVRVKVKANT